MLDNTPPIFSNQKRLDPDLCRISYARRFAFRAHGAQMYDAVRPFIWHLDTVSDLMRPYGTEARILGYVHDVLRDTKTWPRQIYLEFGPEISQCCHLLALPEEISGEDRMQLLHARLSRVEKQHEIALICVAADRLANARASFSNENMERLDRYRREYPSLRAAAYRPGLCDPLWSDLDSLMTQSCRPLRDE